MEDLVDEANWKESEKLASKLGKNVQRLKLLFPKESIGDGRSNKKIWKKWAGFKNKLSDWSLL